MDATFDLLFTILTKVKYVKNMEIKTLYNVSGCNYYMYVGGNNKDVIFHLGIINLSFPQMFQIFRNNRQSRGSGVKLTH